MLCQEPLCSLPLVLYAVQSLDYSYRDHPVTTLQCSQSECPMLAHTWFCQEQDRQVHAG